MTWLDSGGQRSRSQQAVDVMKACTSMLGCRSPSSSYTYIKYDLYVYEVYSCTQSRLSLINSTDRQFFSYVVIIVVAFFCYCPQKAGINGVNIPSFSNLLLIEERMKFVGNFLWLATSTLNSVLWLSWLHCLDEVVLIGSFSFGGADQPQRNSREGELDKNWK